MPAILLMGAYWLALAPSAGLPPLGRRAALGAGVTLAFALLLACCAR